MCRVEWNIVKTKKRSSDVQMNNEWAVINPSVNFKSEAPGSTGKVIFIPFYGAARRVLPEQLDTLLQNTFRSLW